MSHPIWIVDAFTRQPFAGNPAAVCLLSEEKPDRWLQALAAEMNLSETAFLLPGRQTGHWQLRWFTPVCEVDLCGHATLAAAHVLWAERGEQSSALRFASRIGELIAKRLQEKIVLDFPALPAEPMEPPGELIEALGVTPLWVGRSRDDWLVELADAAAVQNLQPDIRRLAQLPCRGVIVTAGGTGEANFVSRFFAPGAGIDEDPVTGSAHCVLAPFWCERLQRSTLVGHQLSRRGGEVSVHWVGERVELSGTTTTVLEGRLRV